jgi:hypothetical protein
MNPKSKALLNSQFRPLKTSKLNPYVMRPTPYGETRISPRLSAIRAAAPGADLRGMASPANLAEAKAHYTSGLPGGPKYGRQIEARQAAADMVRRYRKTGNLSAVARLVDLDRKLTEFARGDRALPVLIPALTERLAGPGEDSIHSGMVRRLTTAAAKKDKGAFDSVNAQLGRHLRLPTKPLEMAKVRKGLAHDLRYHRRFAK